MPGYFRIEQETFVELDNLIRGLEMAGKNIKPAMNMLCQVLAYTGLAQAQKRSRGFVDPNQTAPQQAWKIPVRRITSAYYHGWKVRRITYGVWQVYNDSREAYYIEYGIHTSGRRVRRPIAKLSLLATLRFADPILHRFSNWVFNWGRYSVQSPSMTMGVHPAAFSTFHPGTFGGYVF
jgi:hypothetical protein